MIRAMGMDDQGRAVIVLGLSRENVRRLQAGEPIRVTGESVNTPAIAAILIFAGGTEQGMEAQLREWGLVGPDTITHREG